MTENCVSTQDQPHDEHAPWPELALVASDLDGTLLDRHSRITRRTTQVIAEARTRGVEVLAATGRSHRTAEPLLTETGMRWAICSNGATLYDLHERRLVSQQLFAADVGADLVALASDVPGIGFAWETPEGLFRDDTMAEIIRVKYGNDPWAKSGEPPLAAVSDQLVKIMVGHPTFTLDELRVILEARFSPRLEVSSSGSVFAEMTAPGAEKGQALARLCAELGIDQPHTAAFGDQHNDLGMLRWVGRGYAMANADPAILEAASHRAPHHGENGVARVIERLLASR